jgi:type IX secretion system PorP/SprF family membrane protein
MKTSVNWLKTYTYTFLLALASMSTQAQDPMFTQFYANPLYLNPALTGVERCPRVIANYRNQWPKTVFGGVNYVTYAVSYDQHVDAFNGGLGIQVVNDQSGNQVFNNYYASGLYSYNLPVNRKLSVRLGMQATYIQKSIDWSKLTFGDMIDERYGFIYQTNETPGKDNVKTADFSAGALAFTKMFYGGISVHHLTQPEENFLSSDVTTLPRKYTAHAGFVIPLNKRFPKEGSISPNFLYSQQGGTFASPNANKAFLGIYATKGPIVGGLWFRTNNSAINGLKQESFVALFGLHTDYMRFGYSYDLTISKLTNNTGGSHEISVALLFDCKPKRVKFRYINCPKF